LFAPRANTGNTAGVIVSDSSSFRGLLGAAVIVLGVSVGCSSTPTPSQPDVAVTPPAQPPPTVVKRIKPVCPVPPTAVSARPVAKKPDPKDAPSPSAKDYWKGVTFGRMAFEEIRLHVRHRYIDATVDESRAFAEAAAFALASDSRYTLMLLPQSFYEQRCNHAVERGRLMGTVFKLHADDRFVIVDTKKVKTPAARLSDDEIRALRKKLKARSAAVTAGWATARFSERDFLRVMKWAAGNLGADPKWTVKRAWVAAASGYLYSLDPHSSIIPKQAWAVATKRDPSFEGIGALLTRKPNNDFTIVETPLEGYPAAGAGVRAGDTIIKVDGTSIKAMPLPKVVDRIRGKAGTKVVLTVERMGEPKPLDIAIVRAKVTMKNVVAGVVKGHPDIGYLKIRGFLQTTHRDMMRAMGALQRKVGAGKLRGLVLDLRTNGGGLLNQGVAVANEFLGHGPVVTVRSRIRPKVERYRAKPGGFQFPVVVLVNNGSASAAEIVAAALQENSRALVVGGRTFGKATVQTLFPPHRGAAYFLKLTIARYHTPSDRRLQAVGVHPDVVVPPSFGGKMPLGFREENLSNHLWGGTPYRPKAKDVVYARKVNQCALKTGKARKLEAKDPNPKIKFDYQRAFAADMVFCMAKNPRTLASTPAP